MTIEETDDKKVKSVRLIRQSPTKSKNWFLENKHKIFEVLNQREGGFDVDLAPCGYPGLWGYVSDFEVEISEYHK